MSFANGLIKHGRVVGTGAAINISLGWIPKMVEIINVTDGDKVNVGYPAYILPFTSGGTVTLAALQKIIGATSGATAKIIEVLLVSGTFAGGDAAGYLVVEDITGTFGTEAVYVSGGSSVDDASVIALVNYGVDYDTEVAGTTGNASISPYAGVAAGASKGFTIGSTISESGKLLFWRATRD